MVRIFLLKFNRICLQKKLKKISVSGCHSDKRKFLCGDNVTCLTIEKVCDRKKDCSDGLDEGGICDKFSNNTACELHYCPDVADCYIWPTGPVCVCPNGFVYNAQKKICEVRISSFTEKFGPQLFSS